MIISNDKEKYSEKSNLTGKWFLLAAVVCMAVALHWVAAYFILAMGFLGSSNSTVMVSIFSDSMIVALLLTPLVSIISVILATLRFRYSQRWITALSLGIMPMWIILIGGAIWSFFKITRS